VCVCVCLHSPSLPLYDRNFTTMYKCWYESMTADCTGTPYFLILCCRLSQMVDRWRGKVNTSFLCFRSCQLNSIVNILWSWFTETWQFWISTLTSGLPHEAC